MKFAILTVISIAVMGCGRSYDTKGGLRTLERQRAIEANLALCEEQKQKRQAEQEAADAAKAQDKAAKEVKSGEEKAPKEPTDPTAPKPPKKKKGETALKANDKDTVGTFECPEDEAAEAGTPALTYLNSDDLE